MHHPDFADTVPAPLGNERERPMPRRGLRSRLLGVAVAIYALALLVLVLAFGEHDDLFGR